MMRRAWLGLSLLALTLMTSPQAVATCKFSITTDGNGVGQQLFVGKKGVMPGGIFVQAYANAAASKWTGTGADLSFTGGGGAKQIVISASAICSPFAVYHLTQSNNVTTITLCQSPFFYWYIGEEAPPFDNLIMFRDLQGGLVQALGEAVGLPILMTTPDKAVMAGGDDEEIGDRTLKSLDITAIKNKYPPGSCSVDGDKDGVADASDNCPSVPNPNQSDKDNDGKGDACDSDFGDKDKDGVLDPKDNCPIVPNPNQADMDKDKVGDVCDPDIDGDTVINEKDNCQKVPNADQADLDKDGAGDACDPDIDGDGILNGDEAKYGTDPKKADTDTDGLSDYEEVASGKSDPTKVDTDSDGLNDKDEKANGTDPNKADTDGDKLSDGDEVNKYKTKPLIPDTDGEGLMDGEEVNGTTVTGTLHKSNPLKADTDGDGIQDFFEVFKTTTDPNKKDTDNDKLTDGEELYEYHTNPLVNEDTDGDGVFDGEEIKVYHTDPKEPDTDDDGLKDGDEVNKYKTKPDNEDTDGDGLSDFMEVLVYKSDPLKADTDGDGLDDYTEVRKTSTDPNLVDTDKDGICDGPNPFDTCTPGPDNCPLVANQDQKDSNADGVGDVCKAGKNWCGECEQVPECQAYQTYKQKVMSGTCFLDKAVSQKISGGEDYVNGAQSFLMDCKLGEGCVCALPILFDNCKTACKKDCATKPGSTEVGSSYINRECLTVKALLGLDALNQLPGAKGAINTGLKNELQKEYIEKAIYAFTNTSTDNLDLIAPAFCSQLSFMLGTKIDSAACFDAHFFAVSLLLKAKPCEETGKQTMAYFHAGCNGVFCKEDPYICYSLQNLINSPEEIPNPKAYAASGAHEGLHAMSWKLLKDAGLLYWKEMYMVGVEGGEYVKTGGSETPNDPTQDAFDHQLEYYLSFAFDGNYVAPTGAKEAWNKSDKMFLGTGNWRNKIDQYSVMQCEQNLSEE